MFDCLDILAMSGAIPSAAYAAMAVCDGSFDSLAYAASVAHEEEEEKEDDRDS